MVCWRPANDSPNFLMHYAKGQTAKKHKYIKKEGNRYIYPSNAAIQRHKMKQQSKNMKYDEIGDLFDSAYKDRENGTTTNLEEFEIRRKRNKMPTGTASAARSNYNNQKRHYERFGRNPDFPSLEVLKKKADQSSASAYGFGEKPNAKNKRLTDTGTGGRSIRLKKAVDSAQEAGKKRTEYEKYKQEMSDAKKHDSTSMREWAKRNAEYHRGNFDKAREHEKKSDRAQKVFMKGLLGEDAQYDRSSKRKGKKVTNPTAKKNQKKAKINSIKYKIKSLPRKALKKGKKNLNALLNKIKRR